ncbi:MAG TPA: hypothetical protein VIL19_07420 [Casimicrobiaceae bacterium]
MDMHHGRLVPGLVATVAGAALAGAYLAAAGLGADIGNSPASLAMVFAVFLVPGCASALVMELRARARRNVAPALAFVDAVRPPFPAAEAVADVRCLTQARVDRRVRQRRSTAAAVRQPMAIG